MRGPCESLGWGAMAWRIVVLGVLGLYVLQAGAAGAQTTVAAEYALKAAFLHRFPQFVTWPPAALGEQEAFRLCLTGPASFDDVINELAAGESLYGLPLDVSLTTAPDRVNACHVLFVHGEDAGRASAFLAAVGEAPVLTVGETRSFLDAGGMIALVPAGRNLRFEVDADAARRQGLILSAQLLDLASAVRGGTP